MDKKLVDNIRKISHYERGKEATFWHFISEGSKEEERLPDFNRCERIRWPKPIIEHAEEHVIKVWTNKRKYEKRILLWLEKARVPCYSCRA